MPSGMRKTSGNHFEIYYEQPWGGVASNANPMDIAENQLAAGVGVVAVDGELSGVTVNAASGVYSLSPGATNAVLVSIFTMLGAIYGVDQFGSIYKAGLVSAQLGIRFTQICTAPDGPWAFAGAIPVVAVKVVNSIAYLSVASRNTLYTYDGNTTMTIGSNYSGGLVLAVLDNYLLQLNVNSQIDGPQPNRISWSGPGLYTTWNPSLNRASGFNTLASIGDQLTGFISLASVGIAISAKSLIELSPTGVGIGPFNFTALWNSEVGQGSTYPFTISQYGQLGYCATDNGVYSISTGAGFTDISGAAKSAILGTMQYYSDQGAGNPLTICGDVMLYYYNSNYATPTYVLLTPSVFGTFGQTVNVWLYDISKGTWFNTTFNTAGLCNTQNGTNIPVTGIGATLLSMNIVTLQPLQTNVVGFSQSSTPITMVYFTLFYNGNYYSTVAQLYLYKSNTSLALTTIGPLNLKFRAEQIKPGRTTTIRRVLVEAYGSGTLTLTVSGVPFGDIVLDGTNAVKTYKSPLGVFTGETPQLSIASTSFKGSIVKVMLAGTYADGDID